MWRRLYRGMYRRHKVFGLFLLLTLFYATPALQAQALQYRVAFLAAGADDDTLPFWLTANRYGTVDPQGSNAITRLSLERPFSKPQGWDYAFGVDILGRASEHQTVYAHQLYARLRYGPFQLTVGRKEETSGLVDSSLSVGSMTWSGNATPVPKISIAVPEYTPIPGTAGFMAFKGYLAHGWLDKDRFVESAFVHEKYLFLRFFVPEDFPVHGHAGIVHNVTWGGTHPVIGPLPQDLDAFIRVFTAQRGDTLDTTATLGNTIATYEFGLTVNTSSIAAMAYRQFYLEDKPHALNWRNPWDGLWGVSLKFKNTPRLITGLLWEHVNTKRQGAKYSEGELKGKDSYYFNSIYRSGWTYHGRTIGLPLLFADRQRRSVANNIVIAHHVGLEGAFGSRIRYKAFFTYSRNYGSTRACPDVACVNIVNLRTPRKDQYSVLLETTGSLLKNRPLDFFAALAFDVGELYPENAGVMIGVSWRGRVGR